MFMQALEGRSKKAFYRKQDGLSLTGKRCFAYGKPCERLWSVYLCKSLIFMQREVNALSITGNT